MKNRILLPLLLALAGLVFWLVNAGGAKELEFGALEVDAPEETASVEPVGELPEVGTREETTARLEVAAEPLLGALEPGDEFELTGARPDGSVLVEVHLSIPEGIPSSTPHPFAGAVVHTQAWDEHTFETTPQETKADELGIARFAYPGPIHLDWFRAELPARFPGLTGFLELHLELEGGTLYRLSLVVEESVGVRGRVVDLNGVSLSGVEVSAYYEGDGVREAGEQWDLWYPGHYTTITGAGGRFSFEALPSGESFIGVTPGEWLQIQPDYDGMFGDGCAYELEVGAVRDIGSLMVTRREVVPVTVLDGAGRPVPLATIQFHPQRFGATPMLTEEQWEERFEPDTDDEDEENERLAKEGRNYPRWPFFVQELDTDENGEAEFVAVAGTWRVEARPRLGQHQDAAVVPLELPARELIVRLPGSLTTLQGKVVSKTNLQPVEGVRVTISRRGHFSSQRSDDQGRFEFPGLVRDGSYELTTDDGDHFPVSLQVAGDEVGLVIELRASGSITSWIENEQGKRLSRHSVHLVRRVGRAAADPATAQWLAKMGEPIFRTRTRGTGTFTFLHLHPGNYEIALVLPVTTGETGAFGEAIVEERIWDRWILPATGASKPLVADMSSYKPAKMVQYTHVAGQVKALDTSQLLPGVRIEVIRDGQSYFVSTDQEGHYEFLLPAGKAKLSMSYPGYQTTEPIERNFNRGRYSQTTLLLPLGQ